MSKLLGEPGIEEGAAQEGYFCSAWDLFFNEAESGSLRYRVPEARG